MVHLFLIKDILIKVILVRGISEGNSNESVKRYPPCNSYYE